MKSRIYVRVQVKVWELCIGLWKKKVHSVVVGVVVRWLLRSTTGPTGYRSRSIKGMIGKGKAFKRIIVAVENRVVGGVVAAGIRTAVGNHIRIGTSSRHTLRTKNGHVRKLLIKLTGIQTRFDFWYPFRLDFTPD